MKLTLLMFPILDSQFFVNWNGSQVGMAAHPDPTPPCIQEKKKTVCIKHGTEGKGWNFMSKKGKMEGMEKENVSYPMCWREKNRFEEVPESEMLTDPLVSLIPTFRGYKSHAFTKGSASIKEDFIFFSAEQRLHSLHSDVPSNSHLSVFLGDRLLDTPQSEEHQTAYC